MSIFKMIRRRPTRVMAFTAAAVDNCDDNAFDEYDDENDQKTYHDIIRINWNLFLSYSPKCRFLGPIEKQTIMAPDWYKHPFVSNL